VKTRLTPPLDDRSAAAVYNCLLDATAKSVLQWPSAARVLAVHPPEHLAEMTAGWPGFDLVLPQGPGDLGQKLSRTVAEVCGKYRRGTIAIGADAPDLPADRIEAAADGLTAGIPAICPSSDGGYCLIAVPKPMPTLFEGIDWGGPHVARQTRDAARRSGVRLIELEPWHDVDTFDDLRRLLRRLKSRDEPHLRDLRQSLISLKLPELKSERE
jgi:hypothetical protein